MEKEKLLFCVILHEWLKGQMLNFMHIGNGEYEDC